MFEFGDLLSWVFPPVIFRRSADEFGTRTDFALGKRAIAVLEEEYRRQALRETMRVMPASMEPDQALPRTPNTIDGLDGDPPSNSGGTHPREQPAALPSPSAG